MERLICVLICFGMAASFAIFGLIFLKQKGKACGIIAGYNSKSKEERAQYDEVRISRYYRDLYFRWTAIFVIATIIDIWSYIALYIAIIVWLISFIFHFIDMKSFEKYKTLL